MFVGHYGIGFAAKRVDASIPLWVQFVAVQLLDVVWAPLVLLGVEKVRVVPGITAANPLDLYYMPYSHSLVAAAGWAAAAGLVYHFAATPRRGRSSVIVGLTVLSHWFLDLLVHRPDLPLYDDTAKVGLGLWNRPALALVVEAGLLLGGIWLCAGRAARLRLRFIVLGLSMLGMQGLAVLGPPPDSPSVAAGTGLLAYVLLAIVVWFLVDRRSV